LTEIAPRHAIPQGLAKLLEALAVNGVTYCHWKSNAFVEQALEGVSDLDILIGRESLDAFLGVMGEQGFRPVTQRPWEATPAVVHYYAADPQTGQLLHVHAYFRVVTGGSFLKNYRLPVEDALLEGRTLYRGILPIPDPAVELALLVIRKVLEFGSLPEWILVRREYPSVKLELGRLTTADGASRAAITERAVTAVQTYLPGICPETFARALAALESGSLLRLVPMSLRLQRRLKRFRRYGHLKAETMRLTRFARRVWTKLRKRGGVHTLSSGGAVIAIVGPEATGKSTVVEATTKWLGEHFDVRCHHVGKPPPTWLTWIPSLAIPALRKALPRYRVSKFEEQVKEDPEKLEAKGRKLYVLAVRSLMAAHERRSLLMRVYRHASKGGFVVCDRYPTPVLGAMEGPKLDLANAAIAGSAVLRWASRRERRIYDRLPRPDVVIKLSVAVDIALKRNRERYKPENEEDDYIRRRHVQARAQSYPFSRVVNIDTTPPLDEVLTTVRHAIWSALGRDV
jgi:thymidylate kinase